LKVADGKISEVKIQKLETMIYEILNLSRMQPSDFFRFGFDSSFNLFEVLLGCWGERIKVT
jgi:hypothetical protein